MLPSLACVHDDDVACLVRHVISHLVKDQESIVVLSTWSDRVFLPDEPGFGPQLDPNA